MARNNLAYQPRIREKSYDAQPMPLPKPRLRTIEGQGRGTAAQAQSASWAQTLIVVAVAVVIVLATTSIARVSISNATVQMMRSSESTQAAIDEARAVGLELEVQHSILNNPTRIQDAAAMMGVLPSNQPETLAAASGFSPDIVSQMQLAADEMRAAELAGLIPEESAAADSGGDGAAATESDEALGGTTQQESELDSLAADPALAES